MTRQTEWFRPCVLAALLVCLPVTPASAQGLGFLGGGAGLDPNAAAAAMSGGAGSMVPEGLGGTTGAAPLNVGVPRPPVRNSLAPAATRPTDFADPALQGAMSRPLPALEPNDFQKFVQATTGRLPPIFGASLFEEAPGTFAPVGAVPVPADYVIGPGDEVIIRTSGTLDFELRPVVDRDGQIVLPRVGAVQMAGVRVGDLEKTLTQQIGKSFRNFTVSATLGQLRGIDIYVVGQARRPGKYTLSSLSTLVNALFASGGPNANGSMRRVQLVRANRAFATIDLYEFIARGEKARDVKLLPGDVLVFPSAGERVAITGALNTPAVYELSPAPGADNSIRELLSYSGGMPVLADPRRAQLERVDTRIKAPRMVENIVLDEAGLGRRLKDGDVLTLFPISPQFANAVTLRGNVAAPLRYAFKPGMRIRDLIPDKDALITRDYWLRKNLMVQFEEAPTNDVRRDATTQDTGQKVNIEKARQEVRNILDEVNWEYAVIERLDRDQLKTQLVPFNLGRAVLQGDEEHNVALRPGDVVTIFGLRDLQVPRARQTRLVRVEGEVGAPGIYAVGPDETLPQLVSRVGGPTAEAYLYGTELQRESVRQQQAQTLQTVVRRLEEQASASVAQRQANLTLSDPTQLAMMQQRIMTEERLARERLERLRQMKPSGRIALELSPSGTALPEVGLEDGDRIFIPPRPSFVGVAGAVYNENVILWRPNRTVADYLKSAGPTESADIDNLFVLRADGSVASRGQGGWLGFGRGTLEQMVLAPGDTLVIPEKIDRETTYTAIMRGVKDWTQVIYQLGLGAAAVKVLRN